MDKKKLYFADIDDTTCMSLENHISNHCGDEDEITLIEAIPDNDNQDYIWCMHYGEVGERDQCKKSECAYYNSKSGRGVCMNRGNLYQHGDEVTFKISEIIQSQTK